VLSDLILTSQPRHSREINDRNGHGASQKLKRVGIDVSADVFFPGSLAQLDKVVSVRKA
jgi:hypothetical protein